MKNKENAYIFGIIGKIASFTDSNITDCYRYLASTVLDNKFEIYTNTEKAVEFKEFWENIGTGWVAKISDSKSPSMKTITLQYGISKFTKEQKSALKNNIKKICNNNNIDILTAEERALINE